MKQSMGSDRSNKQCLDSGRKMTYLVYWYGCSNDLQNAYSFQKTSSLTSYEDGMKKLGKKMLTLQQKLSGGKKLSGKETMLLNAMNEMKIDQTKNPEDRSGYLPLPQDGTRNNTVVSTVTATAKVTAPREQRNHPKKAAVDADTDTDRAGRIEVHNINNKRRHHQQGTTYSDGGNDRIDDALPEHSVKKAKMDDCNPRPSTRIRMASSNNNVSAVKKEENDNSNAGSGIHSGGNNNDADTLAEKSIKKEDTVSAIKKEEDDNSNAGSGIHSGGNNNNTSYNNVSAIKQEEDDNSNAGSGIHSGGNNNNTSYNNVSAIKQEEDDNSNAGSGIHSGGNNNNADTSPEKSIKKKNMNNKCDDAITNDGIPTPVQLSHELSRLTSERYSLNEAFGALKKIDQWAGMYDAKFLKSFHAYGGILRVLDFLKVVMTDPTSVGWSKILFDCFEEVTDIIARISYPCADGSNIEIVRKILLTVIDHEYDGIATLIRVSEDCTGRHEIVHASALDSVWRAIANISKTVYNEMTEEQVMALLLAGIATISEHERIVNDDDASGIIVSVFMSFSAIIDNQYMNKAQFQETKLLSKCIDVLKTKNNDRWNCKCERATVAAIRFFDRCRCNTLFDEDSDYVHVLPFLIFGMKTHLRSKRIRSTVLDFIQGACDNMKNKKLIENPAMEGLYALFTRNDIDEEEKKRIRTLIVNTVDDSIVVI